MLPRSTNGPWGSFGGHLELMSEWRKTQIIIIPEPDNIQRQINPLFHIILTPGIKWKGH